MVEVKVEKVMDRKEIADTVHAILRAGRTMLEKSSYDAADNMKLKILRNMGPTLNAAVSMVQQETAQQRLEMVVERMKQLGYGEGNGELKKMPR
jgi:hypothetical protein